MENSIVLIFSSVGNLNRFFSCLCWIPRSVLNVCWGQIETKNKKFFAFLMIWVNNWTFRINHLNWNDIYCFHDALYSHCIVVRRLFNSSSCGIILRLINSYNDVPCDSSNLDKNIFDMDLTLVTQCLYLNQVAVHCLKIM